MSRTSMTRTMCHTHPCPLKTYMLQSLLLQHEHVSIPPIGFAQPPSMPPSHPKRHLVSRVRLVELDAPVNVQRNRSKLPDGTVELLSSEADGRQSVQEVLPGELALRRRRRRIVENGADHLEGSSINLKDRLRIRRARVPARLVG